MTQILFCAQCEQYMLTAQCKCGGTAFSPKPPKYSPQDRYAKYRQMAKKRSGQL